MTHLRDMKGTMRIRTVEDFGSVARQRRRDLGLSQEVVAKRAGVTRQWLVRFEQGNADVSLAKAYSVLDELGLVVRAAAPEARQSPRDIPSIMLSHLSIGDARIARGRAAVDAVLGRQRRDG